MSDVVITGVGQTPVGEHWDITLRNLAGQAILAALQDAGITSGRSSKPQAVYIGNAMAAVLSRQANLGALLVDYAGLGGIDPPKRGVNPPLRGVEGITVEAAGASGGAAVRMAYLAVASGWVDTVLVVGVEKITDEVGAAVEAALAQMLDSDHEAVHGLTPNGQAALLTRRYMHIYDVPAQAFSCFPIIAHANGVHNPNALYRRAIPPATYQRAEVIYDPLNMFDVAPIADGAAALVLTRADLVPSDFPHPLVRISGSSVVTDTLALHDRPDPLAFDAARLSVERACRQSGILPKDADFFELSDAASVYAALSLEAAGFAEKGQGWHLAQEGHLGLDGDLPISTFGGLKARGNPIGATGVYQMVEAVLQLRGEAGLNQVPGAWRGLVQSLGGPASTAITHVVERMGR